MLLAGHSEIAAFNIFTKASSWTALSAVSFLEEVRIHGKRAGAWSAAHSGSAILTNYTVAFRSWKLNTEDAIPILLSVREYYVDMTTSNLAVFGSSGRIYHGLSCTQYNNIGLV